MIEELRHHIEQLGLLGDPRLPAAATEVDRDARSIAQRHHLSRALRLLSSIDETIAETLTQRENR